MGREYRIRPFKSGGALALHLPDALGLKEHDEVVLRESGGRYTPVPVPVPVAKRFIDHTGIAGVCPGLEPLMPEERVIGSRELDWDGAELRRG